MKMGRKVVIGAAVVALFLLGTTLMGAKAPAAGCGGVADANAAAALPGVAGFKGDQLANAAAIMNAASAMGLSERAQTIGVMTAIGESTLVNIGYGDWETSGIRNPDGSHTTSIGLFQQQDSWGSRADRLDPTKAATMFFQRLAAVRGWESMEPSAAAHEVQVNADPNHYTKFWAAAAEIVAALRGAGGGCGTITYPLEQPYALTSSYGPRDTGISGASTWHPAIDLGGGCGDPVFAVQEGTVVESDRLWLSLRHPDGYVISYLHTYKWERLVNIGAKVTAGQQIAVIGNEGPSSGCHLDIRIDVGPLPTPGLAPDPGKQNVNPKVASLARAETIGGPVGFVNPERFFDLFGLPLCPPEWCQRRE